MSIVALGFLWATTVCGPIDQPPHPEASPDSVELCAHISESREQFAKEEYGNAFIAATAASEVSLYEWETVTPLLAVAESACAAGYPELGRVHVDTFMCVSDINTKKFEIEDWYDLPVEEVQEISRARYPFKDGWRVNHDRCLHALEGAFPNDYDSAGEDEKALLYSEARRIKALCMSGVKDK